MATDSAVGVPVRGMAAEATTEGEVMTNEELIREALGVMHCLGIDNLRAKGAIILLTEALRRAETERDAQAKEFARFKAVAALANSVVRWDSLLNEMHEQKARAQRAEQERDAQAALVATLTAERDEARAGQDQLAAWLRDAMRKAAQYDETQAQVWGLICVATNHEAFLRMLSQGKVAVAGEL